MTSRIEYINKACYASDESGSDNEMPENVSRVVGQIGTATARCFTPPNTNPYIMKNVKRREKEIRERGLQSNVKAESSSLLKDSFKINNEIPNDNDLLREKSSRAIRTSLTPPPPIARPPEYLLTSRNCVSENSTPIDTETFRRHALNGLDLNIFDETTSSSSTKDDLTPTARKKAPSRMPSGSPQTISKEMMQNIQNRVGSRAPSSAANEIIFFQKQKDLRDLADLARDLNQKQVDVKEIPGNLWENFKNKLIEFRDNYEDCYGQIEDQFKWSEFIVEPEGVLLDIEESNSKMGGDSLLSKIGSRKIFFIHVQDAIEKIIDDYSRITPPPMISASQPSTLASPYFRKRIDSPKKCSSSTATFSSSMTTSSKTASPKLLNLGSRSSSNSTLSSPNKEDDNSDSAMAISLKAMESFGVGL